MPQFINQYVGRISIERGHPLLVAPELGGMVVVQKTKTIWQPAVGSLIFCLGLYKDGYATSFYWYEGRDRYCFLRRSNEHPPSDRSSCRIEVVPRQEVPLELLMKLHDSALDAIQSDTTSFLGELGHAKLDDDVVCLVYGRGLWVDSILGGRLVQVTGSSHKTYGYTKWIPPKGSLLKEIGLNRGRLLVNYLYVPPRGRKVILTHQCGGNSWLRFASESELTPDAIETAKRESAWYIKP